MAAFRWLLVVELEVKSPRITCSLIPLVTTTGSWNKQNVNTWGREWNSAPLLPGASCTYDGFTRLFPLPRRWTVCMWLTPWRPCCSSRTAASSSGSLTACEFVPHPSPVSQVKLHAGVGTAFVSLLTAVTRKHRRTGMSRPVWAPEAKHIDLVLQSLCIFMREVSLFRRRASKSPCSHNVPGACSGAPSSVSMGVFYSPLFVTHPYLTSPLCNL